MAENINGITFFLSTCPVVNNFKFSNHFYLQQVLTPVQQRPYKMLEHQQQQQQQQLRARLQQQLQARLHLLKPQQQRQIRVSHLIKKMSTVRLVYSVLRITIHTNTGDILIPDNLVSSIEMIRTFNNRINQSSLGLIVQLEKCPKILTEVFDNQLASEQLTFEYWKN